MTELESLRAERVSCNGRRALSADTVIAMDERVKEIDARIAELEREPQRFMHKDESWWVDFDCATYRRTYKASPLFNAFETRERAQEVATHFKRLGLAAQWGALLTDEAMDNDAHQNGCWANGRTWTYYFPTAAQRDGFLADAKREGLL